MNIVELPLQKIKPDPKQPRQNIDRDKVRDMAQSIRTEGIINPIEIDKSYTIITGEMRWRAAKLAGLKTIPCRIITINPAERFRRQVIENIHHNTMTDWDTAIALEKLLDQLPRLPGSLGTHGGRPYQGFRDLGRIIGKSKDFIAEKFDLLGASKKFQKAVKSGLPGTFIRVITNTPEVYKDIIEDKIINGEIKNRDAGLRIADALKRQPEVAQEILDIDYSKHKSVNDTILALGEVAPQRSNLINQSFGNVEEFSRRVDAVIDWLKQNNPTTVGRIHQAEIVLGFNVLKDAINNWGKEVKQLK